MKSKGNIAGRYLLAAHSGTLAAGMATNLDMFHFRWAASTGLICGIRRVTLSASLDGTVFSAGTQNLPISLYRATSFTANASGNNTDLDPGTGGKRMTTRPGTQGAMPSSVIAANQVQICTTAGMTGMTRTLDAQAVAAIAGVAATSMLTPVVPAGTVLLSPAPGDDYAMVLLQDEGLVLRLVEDAPANGVWRIAVGVEWDEINDAC